MSKINYQLLIDQGQANDNIHNANQLLYDQQASLQRQYSDCENQLKELKAGNVSSISSDIRAKEKELSEAENRLYNETNGTGVTKKVGYGPAAKQLQDQVDRLKGELKSLRADEAKEKSSNIDYINTRVSDVQRNMNEINRQLSVINQKIMEKESESTSAQKSLDGFCAQYQALGEITAWGDNWWTKNPLFWARLFITLLFVSIEIIPTLFKMMIASGPYDDMLRAQMYKVKILADKQISDLNDEVNTSVEISTLQNQNRLEAEIAANKELLEKIALAQSEILSEAIELWRKEELEKVRKDPNAYIKSSMEDPIDPQ